MPGEGQVPQVSVIQRAFELAQSGKLESITDLRKTLRREGFSHLDVVETTFPSVSKQIRDMLRTSAPAD